MTFSQRDALTKILVALRDALPQLATVVRHDVVSDLANGISEFLSAPVGDEREHLETARNNNLAHYLVGDEWGRPASGKER